MINFSPIGIVHTPFKEKIGVARQSMMLTEARGVLKLNDTQDFRRAIQELEGFSHLWVIFLFHKHLEKKWRPAITPPRFDGPRRVGVLASRSPHRPNPIGMSALKIESIDLKAKGGAEIHVSGVDILDETPILDIKPYLPFADSFPNAKAGWAEPEIQKYPVAFSPESLASLDTAAEKFPRLQELVIQMLELDPRAARLRKVWPIEDKVNEGRKFAFRFLDFDLRWEIRNQGIYVLNLRKLSENKTQAAL